MSVYPCSTCGRRVRGKLVTMYNAWFDPEGGRVCFRQRRCVDCLTTLMEPLRDGLSAESSHVVACPICSRDASESLRPTFLTIFPPKQPEREYALPTCESCAASLREQLQVGGDLMPDRGATPGGLGPQASPEAPDWGAILP